MAPEQASRQRGRIPEAAARGDHDDLKVVAIRAGRELTPPWRWAPEDLSAQSPKVRRELAIALIGEATPAATWAALAAHDRDSRHD